MLTRLRIQNYALIRELDVELKHGFTIITGETGAGKSILLGALSLILGQRADLNALKDNGKKCVVEAVFNIEGYRLEELFEVNDLDYESQAIIRREISPNGKSRAFVNDTPVTLKALQDIGLRLIDIHSQHQNLELNSQLFQLMVIDNCAGNSELLLQYKQVYNDYRRLISRLKEAEEKAAKLRADLDYFQFQYNQLNSADLVDTEQEELEQELKMLNHAEEIKTGLTLVSDLMNGEEESVLVRIKESLNQINRLAFYIQEGEELKQRLNSVYVELKDICFEVDTINEKVDVDPDRITWVSERLDLIYSLQQKHHVGSVGELIRLREEFLTSIKAVSTNEEEIVFLKGILQEKKEEATGLALKLSAARSAVVASVETMVKDQLMQLGMPNSLFRVEILTGETLTNSGCDQVSFLFTANKNGIPSDISKVASGGEMSRVMLSIKALISKSKALPTIIFDEIDTGISGEIADKMGSILKDISADMQVINITHLPQIAAKGDHHFLVYKFDNEMETVTHLRLLNKQERVDELAKMLSGENITQAAILNAEELLK